MSIEPTYRTHVVPTLARTCDELAMEQQARQVHAALLAARRGEGTYEDVRYRLADAENSIPADSPLRSAR